MDSVTSGTNSSEAQHGHGENILQATGRTLQSRIIAGFVVTAAFLAGTVKISAAQQAVQAAFHVLHVFNKQGDGQAPMAGVRADAPGNLFDSAEFGGANGKCKYEMRTP